MVIGNHTDVIAGEKLITTAGGIDTHIHWICPQQIQEAIASGVTTMFGGGTGPVRVFLFFYVVVVVVVVVNILEETRICT